MKTRKLGGTDLNLTTIGLGTWAIGGGDWTFGWGPQDDKESTEAIIRAIELGINWVDTAPAYGLGHSEEVVGKALKHFPKRPIVATKCGIVWNNKRQTSHVLNAKTIKQEVEASLKRLDIDVIDLYQIHWPDPDTELEAAWEQIGKAVKEGKLRYAGVCNCNIAQLKRIQPIHPVASLQPPYSMIERGAEESGLAGLLPRSEHRHSGLQPDTEGFVDRQIHAGAHPWITGGRPPPQRPQFQRTTVERQLRTGRKTDCAGKET